MRVLSVVVGSAWLMACGGHDHGTPAIAEFTIDPMTVEAGADVTSTVRVEDFELTGEGHDMGHD